MMDVFLVPVGNDRYELYCEPAEGDHPNSGVTAQLLRRVRDIAAAEQEARRDRHVSRRGGRGKGTGSWVSRIQRGLARGMAEWVARQRLFWHLRHVAIGTLVHPADLSSAEAQSVARNRLQHYGDHHRFWMVVDGFGVLVFGPLFFFVPGPNLISWYFAVKTAGHWLAFLGARRGVTGVDWSSRVSSVLVSLRQALVLPRGERHQRLRALSRELHLEHLATFVERTMLDQS